MDTPKLMIKKSKRLSIGRHRSSDSPKTVAVDLTSILNTPPSTRSNDTPNNDNKCFTPLTRKKTFIAEESPSQDYDYGRFSPIIPPSQDIRCEYQDVGWEWGEKPRKSKSNVVVENNNKKCSSEMNEDQSKRKNILPRSKCKPQDNIPGSEKQHKNENKGFHIFKKEIESIKKNNWNAPDDELESSLKENLKKEVEVKKVEASGKPGQDSKNTAKDLSVSITMQKLTNIPETSKRENPGKSEDIGFKDSAISFSCFDDSDMDAMLLEASQNVEENLIKKIEEKEPCRGASPPKKQSELDAVFNFEEDCWNDAILLSIPDNELYKFSPNCKDSSAHPSTIEKNKRMFTRHNSMPYESPQRENRCIVKPLNRHNSMPLNKENGTSTHSSATTSSNAGDTNSGERTQAPKDKLSYSHCNPKPFNSPEPTFFKRNEEIIISLSKNSKPPVADCTDVKPTIQIPCNQIEDIIISLSSSSSRSESSVDDFSDGKPAIQIPCNQNEDIIISLSSSSSRSESAVADFSGSKRLCTKEEMEQKRLEAKKRQLISQQKRLMNSLFNSKVKNSCPSSFSNIKSVKK